ncbi:MAG: NAD(P)-dependent oxidoreductase, partial [Cenarchaeum sp. SB0673_bin_9]|nr:NAD(P)-dependent oxidoreductase [Cenarchaeum sp. SB0673_bin_9]
MIVDLDLKGRLVIVIGGGYEGMLKIRSLLTQDCKILLFSEETSPEIQK